MLKTISKGISLIFHPLFVLFYLLLAMYVVNPYLFSIQDEKSRNILLLSIFMISVVLPLTSILMMRFLGLLSSLQMENKMERVGPLIATAIFYLWLYVNIRSNNYLPPLYQAFVLGSIIALFLGFFINNFTKISLHTIGAGGLLMAFLFIYVQSYGLVTLELLNLQITLPSYILLAFVILIVGLIGTSRIYLNAHSRNQIYMGYLVGIFSQIIAYRIVF